MAHRPIYTCDRCGKWFTTMRAWETRDIPWDPDAQMGCAIYRWDLCGRCVPEYELLEANCGTVPDYYKALQGWFADGKGAEVKPKSLSRGGPLAPTESGEQGMGKRGAPCGAFISGGKATITLPGIRLNNVDGLNTSTCKHPEMHEGYHFDPDTCRTWPQESCGICSEPINQCRCVEAGLR